MSFLRAHKNGTFQEYTTGPASYVAPISEGIELLVAAHLMVLSLALAPT
jgi:hypothetical protein